MWHKTAVLYTNSDSELQEPDQRPIFHMVQVYGPRLPLRYGLWLERGCTSPLKALILPEFVVGTINVRTMYVRELVYNVVWNEAKHMKNVLRNFT